MLQRNSGVSRRQHTRLRHFIARRLKSTFIVPAIGASVLISAATLPAQAETPSPQAIR